MLTGLVFAVSYVIAGIPLGLLIDRVNRVRFVAALLAVWSALTFFSGLARSFPMLILARIGIASAESGASPACMSILSDVFPRTRRATALGLFHASSPLGLLIGFALGGWVAAHFGWRTAFFVAGLPGLALSLFVVLALREPRRGAFDAPDKAGADIKPYPPKAIVAEVWKRKVLRYLVCAGTLAIAGQAAIGAFLAPFLIRIHQLPIDRVGLIVGMTLGVGGMIGMPLGGVFADWSERRSPVGGVRVAALSMLAAALLAVTALLVSSVAWAIPAIALYAILMSFYYAAAFSTFISHTPVPMRGAAIALMIIMMNLGGYGLGPQAVGLLSDCLNNAGVLQPLRLALLGASGFFLIAGIFFWLVKRAIEQDGSATHDR
jgi:predicted MFS family arabinose efflux permease